MENFYDSLRQFGEKEIRIFFYELINTIDRYRKEGSIEEIKLAKELDNILQGHIEEVRNHLLHVQELQRYVHLVFSLSDADALKVALSEIGKRDQCQVLAFDEVFSIGPISNLDTTAGQQNRLLWLMECDPDYRYGQHFNQEHQLANMVEVVKDSPENKIIVIWCADNAHDQTGLRFALHLLSERKQPVHVVNVTKLFYTTGLFNQEGVISYASGIINRDHFQEIVREYCEGAPLDLSQRKRYEAEWLTLSGENHVLRLWKEDTVKGSDVSALDEVILRAVTELEQEKDEDGFIKAGTVVTKVFDTSHQLVGSSFISYRIWILVNQGVLQFRGLPWALYQFSVRLAHVD